MASAACTEPVSTRYVIPDVVRVRRESFGLLFYDTRTTNLTFVRTGERLSVGPGSPDEERELLLSGAIEPRGSIDRLLRTLQEKGLIRAISGTD